MPPLPGGGAPTPPGMCLVMSCLGCSQPTEKRPVKLSGLHCLADLPAQRQSPGQVTSAELSRVFCKDRDTTVVAFARLSMTMTGTLGGVDINFVWHSNKINHNL